jgi:hypothetical protein
MHKKQKEKQLEQIPLYIELPLEPIPKNKEEDKRDSIEIKLF